MKRFLVIGNPIDHTLSPKLHNYWIKKNNIDAIYEKQKLEESDLENLISQVREKKICGIRIQIKRSFAFYRLCSIRQSKVCYNSCCRTYG